MKRFFFQWSSIFLAVILMISCSETKEKQLLQLIPKDADAIVYVSPKKIAEAGQIEKFKNHESITKYFQEEDFGQILESFLNNDDKTGIDFRTDMFGFTKDGVVFLIVSVNNESNLKTTFEKAWGTSLEVQKEQNYNYIMDPTGSSLVAWNGKTALLIDEGKGVDLLESFKDVIQLEENESILENKEVVKFLNSKKAFGVYVNSSAAETFPSFIKEFESELPKDSKIFVDLDFEKGKITVRYRTVLSQEALEQFKGTDVEQLANQELENLKQNFIYKMLASYGLEDIQFSGNVEKGQLEIILVEKNENSLSVILNKLVAFL